MTLEQLWLWLYQWLYGKGLIAEQPENVTVYSAVAREFNTKAEQPGIF